MEVNNLKPFWPFILGVFVAWSVWGASVFFVLPDISDAGQFGDIFGGVNALFTGLGLVFLWYTISQQSEMIRQQQISINQQTQNLTNQKIAAERSQALHSMLQIRAVLQDDETRKAREIVLSGVGKPKDIAILSEVLLKHAIQGDTSLNPDEQLHYRWHQAAERVLHSYDFVGMLVNCGHIQAENLDVIRNTWGQSIKRCHRELREYMKTRFRPKEIRKSDIESDGNKKARVKKLGVSRLHALPYKNFNDLFKIMTLEGNAPVSQE